MHLNNNIWFDLQTEVKLKSLSKKNTSLNFLKVCLELKYPQHKKKQLKLQQMNILKSFYIKSRSKFIKKSDFLSNYFINSIILNQYNSRIINKKLLRYRFYRQQKLCFNLKVKGLIGNNLTDSINRTNLSQFKWYF